MPQENSKDKGQQQPLDKDIFELWRIHPVTKAYLQEFREIRDQLKAGLSSGETLTGNAMETAEATALVLGEIRGLNHLLEAYFEDEETGDILNVMSD